MVTVVLAAGFSHRMGEEKLLLPLWGKPLGSWALEAALEASDRVILVLNGENSLFEHTLSHLVKECSVVYNRYAEMGQFYSTQLGVAAIGEEIDFFLSVADTPLIRAHHYKELQGCLNSYEAVRPYHKGTPGHPVLCHHTLRESIITAPSSMTMRELLIGKSVCNYESDDRAWITDIDTQSEYERVKSTLLK